MRYIKSLNSIVQHSQIITALHCTAAANCRVSVRAGHRLTFLSTPSEATTSNTAWDAYLRQEQLTQKQITLSLTHKGQADHSHAELSPSCLAIHSPHPYPPCYALLHAVVFTGPVTTFTVLVIVCVNLVLLAHFSVHYHNYIFSANVL